MYSAEHPDTLLNNNAFKQTMKRRAGRQAIEDKAIEAYHAAYEQGREEAERVYFETFNKVSHDKK
jgi:hypothetical protein